MHAIGISGAATGKGSHILIVDDAIKNRQEAESTLIVNKLWEELQDSFFSGLNAEYGATINISTRWNQDDITARLLKDDTREFHSLVFPAIADRKDELGRQPGDPLYPEMFSLEHLHNIRKRIAPYNWQSQYQQQPIARGGQAIKRDWIHITNSPPQMRSVVRYWDLAMSESQSADYTAGVKMGYGTDGNYYILDVIRVRKDWGSMPEFLYRHIVDDGQAVFQGIEKAGYMGTVIDSLQRNYNMHGFNIKGYPVTKSKFVRSLGIQSAFAHGRLKIVEGSWNDEYIEELLSFTGDDGAQIHDDQVDATSGAYAMLEKVSQPDIITFKRERW